ncbi:Hint domain-containing protein [Sulfitobacter guttiformis]|nr:Hint domain-containing protein [Sulfitobacter guttiformis]
MPTTFNVISLGVQALIDPTEGNTIAENASALVGLSFGTEFDPLWEQTQSFSPGTTGFGTGNNTAYDQDNNTASEQFRINGGPNQRFDGTAIYNATITYTNGTTANITAVIFQDTAGRTYLAPEFSANSDQTALEAGAIRSLTLNSLSGNNYSGLTATRQTSNFAVCFTEGTRIQTPAGACPVQHLKVGDLVDTLDNGPQPVRWINGRTVPATGAMMPVVFTAGSLGSGLPLRTMALSRQHRLMLDNVIVERMTGNRQALVPACKLLALPGVCAAENIDLVTYWHFLCDAHQIVFAEGTPVETLYLGHEARKSLSPLARSEISQLFPELMDGTRSGIPARPLMNGTNTDKVVARLNRNAKAAITDLVRA